MVSWIPTILETGAQVKGMVDRISGQNARMVEMSNRITEMSGQVKGMVGRTSGQDARLEEMSKRITEMSARITSLETRMTIIGVSIMLVVVAGIIALVVAG
jgi:methyl-accepting chemotaxis protein